MTLPAAYAWLATEPAPRMLLEALKLYGTLEAPGAADNPVILGWAREVGLEHVYRHDATAWCGLAMAVVAKRAGKAVAKNPLWALNWGLWGEASAPELGAVLTFIRIYYERGEKKTGGHVGLYVGEDAAAYHVLGGNQSDAFNIKRIDRTRLRAARALYTVGKPPNVRPVVLAADGTISANEA